MKRERILEKCKGASLSFHQNIDPDKHMSKLPKTGERTIQRINRNRAQHLHMAGNSTCFHQPDWKNSVYTGLWVEY